MYINRISAIVLKACGAATPEISNPELVQNVAAPCLGSTYPHFKRTLAIVEQRTGYRVAL